MNCYAVTTQGYLYSIDISGRNLKKVTTRDGGSDPSWALFGK